MTPDLLSTDILGGVRKEIERNALRARNGLKYVAGSEWAPVGPTPSEVVWEDGAVELRRYGAGDGARRYRPAVLAFLGLVSRAYVFDLVAGNSFVRRFLDAGLDIFVLDWGRPGEDEAGFTLETYVQQLLPRAIDAVLAETGDDEVSMVGYCMGGDLALLALAADPDLPVRSLMTMATPIDFRHMGPIAEAVREGRLDPESFLDETGNIPPGVVSSFLRIRRPTADLVTYANLWQNLWNDEYMEGHQAMARYIRDHVPIAGATFLQVVKSWLRENAFLHDRLRLDGRRVSLGAITTPVLAVVCERDDLVPLPAAEPIADVLTGTDVEFLRLDAGHSSLVVGRTAARVAMPAMVAWLVAQSEEEAR